MTSASWIVARSNVVLLHRARMLASREPDSRVLLTTFTKNLAGRLRTDLERLAFARMTSTCQADVADSGRPGAGGACCRRSTARAGSS